SHATGLAPVVQQQDNVASGTLEKIERNHQGKIVEARIRDKNGLVDILRVKAAQEPELEMPDFDNPLDLLDWLVAAEGVHKVIVDDLEMLGGGLREGQELVVSKYSLRGVEHYLVRQQGKPMRPVYDYEAL